MNVFIQDQRLVILRSLLEAGYDANESILSECLSLYGHNISRDLLANHLYWLEEQGLIKLSVINSNYLVAKILKRGQDVAEGRSFVAGVKRPSPSI